MKRQIYPAAQAARPAPASKQAQERRILVMNIFGRPVKRALLALAIIGVADTFSGCVVVPDDEGHHHEGWHRDYDRGHDYDRDRDREHEHDDDHR
jgi:hypothetical protein